MNTGKPKILCVDDNQDVLDSLVRVLRSDFEVITARSGEEGLQKLEISKNIDLVMSDYRMPGLSGVDFLRQVKIVWPHTVRMILSGEINLQQVSDAINSLDIHRLILKPWDNDYLRVQMLEALQSRLTIKEKQRWQSLALTDPVTQLTNHRYFQERLHSLINERAKEDKDSLILAMIDVDHFKGFNDRYGHPEGDRLLFEIAQRLQGPFPAIGQVSRYGGEEFAIILNHLPLIEAVQQLQQLRNNFETQPLVGPNGRSASVTVSIGVAQFPTNATSAKQLIERADEALYQAKNKGRNQLVCFQNKS